MAPSGWPRLVTLLISLIWMVPKSTSQPYFLGSLCTDESFANNSQYQTNRNTLFQSLTTNATTHPDGFYSTSVGNTSNNTVFGLFLCRGDQNTTSCHECVANVTSSLENVKCPYAIEGIQFNERCTVRYTNESILGILSRSPRQPIVNGQNITGNISHFMDAVGKMIKEVAAEAMNGGSRKKFAKAEMPYSSLQTVYGYAQCTPDLTAPDCNVCLRSAIALLRTGIGARTLMPSCRVRYEIYPFLNDAANISPPSSPSPTPNAPVPPSSNPPDEQRKLSSKEIIAIVISGVAILAILVVLRIYFLKKKGKKSEAAFRSDEEFKTLESLQYDLDMLQSATNYFSDENKLGEGGFGCVYKGVLEDGKQITVKRLSKGCNHGAQQFKNEVLVLANLRHQNLVKLLGFCLEKGENLLVYEYVDNKSLDYFLFGSEKQGHLDWKRRYKIIGGIAKGMLYLHEDCDPKIIHRDLKVSNILLDKDLNPKVADFGTARIFCLDQTHATTSMIIGTYGYMSPEYAMHGEFSTKSDVYSFGVLVLEIISGKKNNKFYQPGHLGDLPSYAWKLWRDGNAYDFVDPAIRESCASQEVMSCINMGLLCVQEAKDKRPSMSTVVRILQTKSVSLGAPQQPGFFIKSSNGEGESSSKGMIMPDKILDKLVNDVTMSDIGPR